MSRSPHLLVVCAVALAALLATPAHLAGAADAESRKALHQLPIEDYSPWQPVKKCSPKAKPGTKQFARWTVNRFGGSSGNISRRCGSTSEHTEGRAWDWPANVNRKKDRKRVKRFLAKLFQTDRADESHALARRMGVMYVIWNDKMYAAWDDFEAKPYLSSSCKSKKKCSKTLRHRDHVHVSLNRRAARAKTSWYTFRSR